MEKAWLKHYDRGVPHSLSYPSIPLQQFLTDTARKYPDRPALIFFNHSIPYHELHALADRFAAALQKLGVRKGDRVALYLPNCPQFVISYYGALRAGAIVVPFNPLYVAREVELLLNDSGAAVLVTLSRFYPTVREVRARTPVKQVIVTNIKEYFPPLLKLLFTLAREKRDGHRVDISGEANTHWFPEVLAKAPTEPSPAAVDPHETAVLMYTGGTTGIPKGAELTHRNLVTNAIQVRHWMADIQEGKEVIMTALPLTHSYAMTVCMNQAVSLGATQILIPNPRELDTVLKAIHKHKPTLFPGVPTLYVAINNHPDVQKQKYDLRSINACISGAAGLPAEVQTDFQRITGGKLVEGYGLTEASPVTHCNPIQSGGKIGSIGLPFPDTEAKVVDLETGERDLAPGEIGELAIRGPQVMKGYWNRPDETRVVLRNGWLYTGDIAKMDTEGFFSIVDRKKDMIIVSGFNVYPREVEEVLYMHPKVKVAAVAGIAHPKRGETVKAWVVLKEGETASAEELLEFCKERLARFKVPSEVEFRTELPMTMVGKVLRRYLVEDEAKKLQATPAG